MGTASFTLDEIDAPAADPLGFLTVLLPLRGPPSVIDVKGHAVSSLTWLLLLDFEGV